MGQLVTKVLVSRESPLAPCHRWPGINSPVPRHREPGHDRCPHPHVDCGRMDIIVRTLRKKTFSKNTKIRRFLLVVAGRSMWMRDSLLENVRKSTTIWCDTKVSAIYVTKDILWAFMFSSRTETIWAPSQLSVCSHTTTFHLTTISRFLTSPRAPGPDQSNADVV